MNNRPSTYHKSLHLFSVFTACCTFCLIIAGGLVTSTGSSLAVPDWPLAYGMVMPPMVGGILYEHGHRLIATFVGLLTVVLTVWLWRREERRWLKILGIVALASVITQGLLGGLTVVLLLPTAISVSHATLAQTFFVIVSSIALVTSRWWIEDYARMRTSDGIPLIRLATASLAAVYIQLILGALMRHTGSGLVIPDFPLAYGQLIPSISPDALARYNQELIYSDIRLFADGAVTSSQIVIHMLHRLWAVVTAVMVCAVSYRLWKKRELPPRGRGLSYVLVGLVAVQITLGAYTVISRKAVDVTTAHVAVGALILVTSMLLLLHLVRMYQVRIREFSILYSMERVAV